MKRHHYLSAEESEKIKDFCKRKGIIHLLRIFNALALKTDNSIQLKMFTLSGADLLYFVLYSIDELRQKDIAEDTYPVDEINSYSESLWDFWVSHIKDNKDYPEEEIKAASTLIISTLENCLHIVRLWQDARDKLKESGRKHNHECREKVEGIIEDIMYSDNNSDWIKDWLLRYVTDKEMYSDDITGLIENYRHDHTNGLDVDEELLSKLKPFFFDKEDETAKFIRTISGKSNTEITAHISNLKKNQGKIKLKTKKALHTILYDYNLYTAQYSTFNSQIR